MTRAAGGSVSHVRESLFALGERQPAHPCKYTQSLLVVMANMLKGRELILDPFGGQGGIFQLEHWLPDATFEAVELEPEWCAKHPKTTLGNALDLPFPDSFFDAICTSPAYGNRMADPLFWDGTKRMTYAGELGRELHPDNGGALQWGPKYRDFHMRAWLEARRVLAPAGALVLNIKDHIRNKSRVYVTDWHIESLGGLGFRPVRHEKIDTPSYGYGANSEARIPYESVILFQLESKP